MHMNNAYAFWYMQAEENVSFSVFINPDLFFMYNEIHGI